MNGTILIADDEDSIRRLIERVLEARHFNVLSASDGTQALLLGVKSKPDLILLDVNMPGQSGLSVLRALRRDVQTRMIPVILITGNGNLSDKIGGIEEGADDYITKPFSLEELSVRVESLLKRSQQAMGANPLTRLPGSPSIEAEVGERLARSAPLAMLYADIDHFKPFNDVYGFERGDQMILAAAAVFTDALRELGGEGDFVGHIGGDDFVLLCHPSRAPALAQRIVTLFDERIPPLYDQEDRARGTLCARDRLGRLKSFPLSTLSIGIASSAGRRFTHYAEVVQAASEMKAYCKSQGRGRLSRFAFDRRGHEAI